MFCSRDLSENTCWVAKEGVTASRRQRDFGVDKLHMGCHVVWSFPFILSWAISGRVRVALGVELIGGSNDCHKLKRSECLFDVYGNPLTKH